MSKPLVLTIHPRLEDTNLNVADIRQGRWTELRMKRRKRLTDAELAAEFHRAVSSFHTANDMADLMPGPDAWHDQERDRGWMYAMERFATLPSYDEETA